MRHGAPVISLYLRSAGVSWLRLLTGRWGKLMRSVDTPVLFFFQRILSNTKKYLEYNKHKHTYTHWPPCQSEPGLSGVSATQKANWKISAHPLLVIAWWKCTWEGTCSIDCSTYSAGLRWNLRIQRHSSRCDEDNLCRLFFLWESLEAVKVTPTHPFVFLLLMF